MNKYEEENLKRILDEIKEVEKKEPNMSDEKKAYYLYHSLGEIYMYKANYMLSDAVTDEEYYNKINIYNEGTSDLGEAICIDMNETFKEGLTRLGIQAHLSYTDSPRENPLTHADVSFKTKSGNWYFANLTSDIMRIKTGMKVRNFGISQERIKEKLYNKDPNKNKLYHLFKMNRENEDEEFTEIQEEQLKQWDDEFGYTFKGMYTNDIIYMMAQETLDEKFMQEFFGTTKKDEIVQKKVEFVMDKIGIINVHRRKSIGDVEASEYYMKIGDKIFSEEEKEKYLEYYMAFQEENGERKARNIIVVKKEMENIYYLYNSKTQIFERIDKEQLIKLPIKNHNIKEQRIEGISETINRIEERITEKENEFER